MANRKGLKATLKLTVVVVASECILGPVVIEVIEIELEMLLFSVD